MGWREDLAGKSILIVPVSHSDWAWTYTRRWHEERYALVLTEVLDLLKERPDFRFTLEQESEQLAPFLKRCPERWDELVDQVRAGRIGISGAVSVMRPNVCGPETFLRNLALGRRYFQDHFPGADLCTYVNADTAGAHAQLPQILKLAGYSLYRWWRPLEALDRKSIPHTFRWRGLDGSEILASRGSYNGLASVGDVPDPASGQWDDLAGRFVERNLVRPGLLENEPSAFLWLSQGTDDTRPLRDALSDALIPLLEFMDEWNRRESIPLRFATAAEYAQALTAGPELPLHEGAVDAYDVGFNPPWGGSKGLWWWREQVEQQLLLAETAAALGVVAPPEPGEGPAGPDASRLGVGDAEWHEAAALNAHAMQWLFQEDYDRAISRAACLAHHAGGLAEEALETLGARTLAPHLGAHTLVWNPLPHPRRVVAPVHFCFVGDPPRGLRVLGPDGRELAHQPARRYQEPGDPVRDAEEWVEVVVPAGGYTLLTAVPAEAEPPPPSRQLEVLDNGVLRLGFRRGRLIRVSGPGDCLLEGTPPQPVHELAFLRYEQTDLLVVGPLLGVESFTPMEWSTEESGPVRWVHRASGALGRHPAVARVLLYRGQPWVEFEVEVDCRGDSGLFAARFPMDVDADLWADIPFGVEPRSIASEPKGNPIGEPDEAHIERLRSGQFYAQSWVDSACAGTRYGVVAMTCDRYWIHDGAEGRLAHVLFATTDCREGWGRHLNEQFGGRGRFRFRYALVPHPGDWQAAGLPSLARSLRHPVVITPRRRCAPDGTLPPTASLVRVLPQQVQMTAIYPNRQGWGEAPSGVTVRLVNLSAADATAEVTFARPPAGCRAVDLLGSPADVPCHTSGDSVLVDLAPWRIATVVVEFPA